MILRALRALALVVAVLLPSPAGAQRERGIELYRLGVSLYNAGKYAEAIAVFKRSLEAHRHKNTLYAIGEAYRRTGDLRRSQRYYSAYAALLGPPERGALERKLERMLAAARSRVAVTTHPGGALVTVNGERQGRTPATGSLELNLAAGPHTIRCALAGHRPVVRQVRAEFGEPIELHLHLERRPRRGRLFPPQPPPHVAAPAEEPPRLFIAALVGPAVPLFGDVALSADPTVELGLEGGWVLGRLPWRVGRLDLHVHAAAFYAHVRDAVIDDRAAFVNLLVGLGARWFVVRSFWIDLRAGIGTSILIGARSDSFLVNDPSRLDMTYLGLLLRPSLGVGWRVWRDLSLQIYPVALDYSPRVGGFDSLNPRLQRVLRYHVCLGVGWQ